MNDPSDFQTWSWSTFNFCGGVTDQMEKEIERYKKLVYPQIVILTDEYCHVALSGREVKIGDVVKYDGMTYVIRMRCFCNLTWLATWPD